MCKTYVFWTVSTIIATVILVIIHKALSLLIRNIRGNQQINAIIENIKFGNSFWADNDSKSNCNISQSRPVECSVDSKCSCSLYEPLDKADAFTKNMDNGCFSGQQFKMFTSNMDVPLGNKPTRVMNLCEDVLLQHTSCIVSGQKTSRYLLRSKPRPSKIPVKSQNSNYVNNKNIKRNDECVSSSMVPHIKSYFPVYDKRSRSTDRKDISSMYAFCDTVYDNLNDKTKFKEADVNLNNFMLESKPLKCAEIVKQTIQNSMCLSRPHANLSSLNLNSLNSPKNITACEKISIKKEKSLSHINKANAAAIKSIQYGKDINKGTLKLQIKNIHSGIRSGITFECSKMPKSGKPDPITSNGFSQQISKFKSSDLTTIHNKVPATKNLKLFKDVSLENQYPVNSAKNTQVVSSCETKYDFNTVVVNKNLVNKSSTSQIRKYLESSVCIMCGSYGFAVINVNTGRRVAEHRFRTEFEVRKIVVSICSVCVLIKFKIAKYCDQLQSFKNVNIKSKIQFLEECK